MTLGLLGFGGAVIMIQPLIGWTDALAEWSQFGTGDSSLEGDLTHAGVFHSREAAFPEAPRWRQ